MGGSAGSRLIGRDAEGRQLYEAMMVAAQGQPQLVLVTGEAGIGKTSLVSDLLSRAPELEYLTATGHCLDIEAAISFSSAIEALRILLFDSSAILDGPHARRMRALLDPDAPSPDRVRMLDDLRLTFLEFAADRPLLLLIEDMHWADRSTLELVSALARTARGRLLLVLTVRSDELHRRHPFRTALSELAHLHIARRIELGPLDRGDIAILIRERSGVAGSAESEASIHARSEGNPLYAEELIDARQADVPEHLADLLLSQVNKLSDESLKLVRAASADGSRLDTELLAVLSGLAPDTLASLLQQAIDVHVLRQRGSVLEFRHGLIREAVYDDLLPDERTRIHAKFAESLQAHVDGGGGGASLSLLSRLAFHWSLAHDPVRTLAASVRAGVRALHFGTAEAVTHLQRALALWDRVPNPEDTTGRVKTDLLLLLAQAHLDNEERALFEVFTREAVRELGHTPDPLLASRAYATLTRCQPAAAGSVDDAEALRLALMYAGTTPSPELAQALSSQSAYHHRRGHGTPALEAAEHAAHVAQLAGDPEREVEALHFCAIELDLLGCVGQAVATESQAVRVARDAGRLGHALFVESNLAWFQLVAGAGDQALEKSIAGLEESLVSGQPVLGIFCGVQAFAALLWQGRFDDASRLSDRLATLDVGTHWPWREELRQELDVARGDWDNVAQGLAEAPRFVQTGFHHGEDETDVDRRVTALLGLERTGEARELAESYLSFVEGGDSPVRHAAAAFTAYRASRLDPGDELRSHADQALARVRPQVTDEWRTSLHGLRFAMADAYCSRFRGEPAATGLRDAVGLGERLGAFLALEPRLMLAEELLTSGERDEGRELLVELWNAALAMGAGDHERRAVKLATRTRVPLPIDTRVTGPLARLTPREREVLDLLADGASNRAIAERLFITEKTASVHVSNLLAKLDVPNRGAAAALARRLAPG